MNIGQLQGYFRRRSVYISSRARDGIGRMVRLVAYLLLITSTPCFAQCKDMSGLPPLESESSAGKPINKILEAFLHDAETIYTEAAHVAARRPRTDIESLAISRMENLHDFGESFHVKECHFQQSVVSASKSENPTDSETASAVLERLWQFDNFIFRAENDAESCSNTKAQFYLNLSRMLLDHAWLEFKGKKGQRDWEPADIDGPQTHETCANAMPLGLSPEQMTKIIEAQIEIYRKDASKR